MRPTNCHLISVVWPNKFLWSIMGGMIHRYRRILWSKTKRHEASSLKFFIETLKAIFQGCEFNSPESFSIFSNSVQNFENWRNKVWPAISSEKWTRENWTRDDHKVEGFPHLTRITIKWLWGGNNLLLISFYWRPFNGVCVRISKRRLRKVRTSKKMPFYRQ